MSRLEGKHDTQEKQTQLEAELPIQDAESLHSEFMLRAKQEGIQPAFLAKVTVLNRALADIGMGRYQWELFITAGFGWFADNICELNTLLPEMYLTR